MEHYITKNPASGPNSNAKTEPLVKVIAAIATLGGLLFGYDTGVISGVLLFMGPEMQLTPFTTGLVTSSLLVGAATGAVVSGSLADRLGRRKIILILAVIFAIGALGTALAPNLTVMVFSRVILGLAVGGAGTTVPVYLAEIAPANRRGQLVTISELMIVTGQLLAYVSNFAFNEIWGGENTWRWMLGIATIPAILLWFGMLYMPDTPRWYALKGRLAEARNVLNKTRAKEDVEWEMMEIEETVAEQSRQKGSLKDLRVPWMRKVFLIGVAFAFFHAATAVNSIMYYAPTILQNTGLSTDAALFATIANGVVSVIMVMIGIVLLGYIGRRTMAALGQIGCTCCLFLLAAISGFMPEHVGGDVNLLRSYLVLGGMLLFLCFLQGAYAPVIWLMLSEMFPVKIRGICMGGAVCALWGANVFIAMSFPILLDTFGLAGAFCTYGVIGLFGIVFVLKYIPETRNRSLEQIEHYLRDKYDSDFAAKAAKKAERNQLRQTAGKTQEP
ncbi:MULTISPECIES: sugar porter family MFS transporter [unclassified Brenneria]|uniref:sugar porter family MFS transporter n=1 Tax=unclassified Brenneria TaxID=2634434 RepID=UPI001553E9AB|nr:MULTISPECIES: sugar porter family MFS transporter [unclassified Brenneria]MBJ7223914.1 sugar porter family MFS transporter [Brenneria sp. L3-3C-1]MEE3645158.1 sugar porter family MFS transporter [Brenneria sp. L3_3C_1]MEE3649959.1 sugar porter family MFS transporter [Brenneria sp. HEZEL_4_2_4]NPC99917.1 sugar porter family MFS transporter [Brenneria sp. hezel4-2-4]